ncbi:polysaccharide biosynthesis protein [Metabacillus sp. GX 13764]|uniref:putative polysaccharide biosynthesis protein n=1 Tax=Metabacillus kandeliae TaxID=2900151 RepID=UPI001E486817|nr:polysaccharide biosynthesis protein [Metabacillus kandeliae]MCD7036651.1 polysaccharide biosynthesis protein [Metabacillus kandeliae]
MDVPSNQHKQLVWQGAIILTIAGIVTKILSAAYRVPYQNIVGDIGFYIYQQVYPFYGIAIMLATSGFPVIVSKLFAEYGDQGNPADLRKVWKVCLLFLSAVGAVFFLLLFFGSGKIAEFMGDPRLTGLIQVISFSFLILPFVSLLRGYFQGLHIMFPTALSQVVEQSIRVLTILLFSYILLSQGKTLYQAGAGALFGSLTGGVFAAGVLSLFFVRHRRTFWTSGKGTGSGVSSRKLLKSLLLYSLTICISSLLLIFVQLIDALNLYSLLTSNGAGSDAAKQLKGIYDRGQPLIQLGTVVASSLSLSLVPLISSAKKRNDHLFIEKKINLSLKVCLAVGAGAAAGLMTLVHDVNVMLFRNDSGSDILFVLSLSILFTSLSMTISAILQGMNHTVFPAIAVAAAAGVKIALNYYLIPVYGTAGAAWASVMAFFIAALLNIIYLRKIEFRLKEYKSLGKILLSALIMAAVLKGYMLGFETVIGRPSRGASSIEALTGVAVGGAVYLILIVKGNVFTDDELDIVPFGSKIKQLFSKRKGEKR